MNPHQPFAFSTEPLPMCDRAAALLGLRDRGLLPIEPLPDRDVLVDILKWDRPDLKILSGTLCGVRQHSTSQHSRDELLLGLNLFGDTTITHAGRDLTVHRGDGFVVNVEHGTVTVARPLRTRFVGLRVPRATLAPLTSDVRDGVRAIARSTGTIGLLAAYVRALLGSETLAVPETGRLFAAHVHDLIALAVGPTPESSLRAAHCSVPAVRLQAIKSDIVARLGDDRLDVSAVAARQGITPRYLHRLFERDGLTYSRFVLEHRLDRAHRFLCDPRLADRTISAIAFGVGFGDLSYFNRTFRQRYHMTPKDVRTSQILR
jgi:AraC-like DNA-binding protein